MANKIVGWRVLALICAVLLVGFAWAFWRNRQDLRAVEEQKSAFQQTLTRLQNEQLDLKDELKLVGSEGYLETRAREEYGFLKPGELRFEITNPKELKNYTKEEFQIYLQELLN